MLEFLIKVTSYQLTFYSILPNVFLNIIKDFIKIYKKIIIDGTGIDKYTIISREQEYWFKN